MLGEIDTELVPASARHIWNQTIAPASAQTALILYPCFHRPFR